MHLNRRVVAHICLPTSACYACEVTLHLEQVCSSRSHNSKDNTNTTQEASIPRKLASTIGISVDPRRTNHSQESLTANVERLKAYKARLILFPRKSGQHKKLDSSESDVKGISDGSAKTVAKIGAAFAINSGVGLKHGLSEKKASDIGKGEEAAYRKLRDLRSEARYAGVREKRAKLKAEAEDAKKK